MTHVIHTTDHQSFCYPHDPELFDDLTIQLWADGDVRIKNEEADIIITLDDLADITKELIGQMVIHNTEMIATIRKKLEVIDAAE